MDKTQIDNDNNKNYSGNHTSAKEQKELCRVFLKGESYDFPEGTTFREIADKVQDQYENDILLAYFDVHRKVPCWKNWGKNFPTAERCNFLRQCRNRAGVPTVAVSLF